MTTGGRGIHLVVPLDRRADFDAVRDFARDAADVLAGRHAGHLTTEALKNKRHGRLFLDVMRNSYAQTAVPPYAVRARAGAPVAVPIAWRELSDPGLTGSKWNTRNIASRLRKKDPWENLARHGRSLKEPRRKLDRLLAIAKGG